MRPNRYPFGIDCLGGATFQSPPPKRGACDAGPLASEGWVEKLEVSIPSAEAGGVRPLQRQYSVAKEDPWHCFNPLRRSGGRATSARWSLSWKKPLLAVSIPSAEAGGVRRKANGVWVLARVSNSHVSIPSAEAGGVRLGGAIMPDRDSYYLVSIPSAEAGGVRRH